MSINDHLAHISSAAGAARKTYHKAAEGVRAAAEKAGPAFDETYDAANKFGNTALSVAVPTVIGGFFGGPIGAAAGCVAGMANAVHNHRVTAKPKAVAEAKPEAAE